MLIACSASKADGPGPYPPRELYTGSMFRAALAYAESAKVPWAVLSAKYGLLLPSRSVAPYEQKLTRKEGPEWAAGIVRQLDDLGLLVAGTGLSAPTWEIHAGALYADPLVELLRGTRTRPAHGRRVGGWRSPESVREPLRGLQIGQRLAWYAARKGEP